MEDWGEVATWLLRGSLLHGARGRLGLVGRVPAICLLGAMRCVARMPWRVQCALGATAGRLLYRLMRRRRRIAETNVALCFPHLDDAARSRLVRPSLPIAWHRTRRDCSRLVGQ